MASLVEFNADFNNIKTIISKIVQLRNLEVLKLYNNSISYILPEIVQLGLLMEFDLQKIILPSFHLKSHI